MQQFPQLLVNGIVSGSALALVGIALVLIVGVTGRFHFALSSSYVVGAYVLVMVGKQAGVVVGAVACIAAAALTAMATEYLVYRPIARRSPENALVSVFVAAFGLVLVTDNLVRLVFSSGAGVRGLGSFRDTPHRFGSLVVTNIDFYQVGIGVIVVVALTLALQFTRWGRQAEAVRANPDLSRLFDISPARIFVTVFAIGGGIAGLATIAYTLRNAAAPDIGVTPVFYGFVIAFLAGFGAPPWRTALVGVAIGVATSISTLWLSPSLSDVVVFGALFGVLTWRSLMSKSSKKPRLRTV